MNCNTHYETLYQYKWNAVNNNINIMYTYLYARVTQLSHIVKNGIAQYNWDTRVEAGSNTSTVTLRVVEGDEMELKKRPRHSLSG
jgi:predicted phage gp36 major capsid-like protein